MKKMKKNSQKIENNIKKLTWERFCESGEIGAYLLYKRLSEEDGKTTDRRGNSSKDA